jgi:hypothetical protein
MNQAKASWFIFGEKSRIGRKSRLLILFYVDGYLAAKAKNYQKWMQLFLFTNPLEECKRDCATFA